MNSAILGTAGFLGILGLLAFYFRLGRLSFWRLAAEIPNEAYEWFTSDRAWVLSEGAEARPNGDLVGPFVLVVPRLGRMISVYAHRDEIEDSQSRFMEQYRDRLPRRFPILSSIALLYPVLAMLSLYNTPAPTLMVLSYGFANLGYLLALAFVVPGHFRILGLDGRLPTLLAALAFWIVGVVLMNVV